tara:strand:- start:128 stop:511 length:384 start_codon:yes stop_codon:yes gene_type:complete
MEMFLNEYDEMITVSDNYDRGCRKYPEVDLRAGIVKNVNHSGKDENGRAIFDYYITFTEDDRDLMLVIYKKINKCLSCFTFSLENAHDEFKIVGLTNKEAIKIIALYDIHQKEIEIEILKIQLKGLN